jgi:hypothetical protein
LTKTPIWPISGQRTGLSQVEDSGQLVLLVGVSDERLRYLSLHSVESWPKRNAKKKEIKIAVGDYVMLHQPVHVPGAATKLTTSWNGPWKVVGRRSKEFDLVHIESGKRAAQHVTNLTSAPDPAHEEDYNDQYAAAVQKVNPVGRIPTVSMVCWALRCWW